MRHKATTLLLLLNTHCNVFYGGKKEISVENAVKLYPDQDDKKDIFRIPNNWTFKANVPEDEYAKTLFLYISIPPKTTDPSAQRKYFNKEYEAKKKEFKDSIILKEGQVLNVSLDFPGVKSITTAGLNNTMYDIRKKIIEKKRVVHFDTIVATVIYDNEMRHIAQKIMKDLTEQKNIQKEYRYDINEVCFNEDHEDLALIDKEKNEVPADEKWNNPNKVVKKAEEAKKS